MHSRIPLVMVACAGVLALAACGSSTSGSGSGSKSSSDSTSASPTAPSTAATTSTPAPGPTSSSPASVTTSAAPVSTSAAPHVPLCLNDIRVIPGTTEGAAGHLALVLVFNNVSTTSTCEIIGYPGVDLVTPSGTAVAHLTRTLRGMAGGEPAGVTAPQPVILAPGASASALAEASDVPQGGITDCGNYSLLITVPDQYVSVPGGTSMLPRCEAQIHPVVPGTHGGLN